MESRYHEYEPLFGSWTISEKLDEGSVGELFRIRKTDAFGNEYSSALKVISIPAGGEGEMRAVMASGVAEDELEEYYQGLITNASNEFGILSRLKGNSNIISYEDHEIIRHKDSFGWDILIRMEEVTPLLEYASHHEMTESDVLKMGIDVCRGLALCSRSQIIHRDIKPENIFVSDAGVFKIGDFGIARIVDQTKTSLSRKGTYIYMAPEMFRGDPYTESVDVYSLGLVMYKYLNHGRAPFMPDWPQKIVYEDSENAFLKRLSGAKIPEPANGSPRLKEIVCKACAYNSADRYANAQEMLEDLEELRREQSHSPSRTPSRHISRKRKRLAVAAAVLLAVACVIFLMVPKDVTSIDGIDPDVHMLMGESLAPTYTIKPFYFKDSEIRFSSSDESVFQVDEAGAITAVAPGDEILTIQSGDYARYVHVLVDPKVTAIENITDVELTEGDTRTLKPELKPAEYADEPVTYSSRDKSIASISKDGKISAKKAGITTMTVSAGGSSRELTVTVQAAPEPEPEPVVVYSPSSSGSSSKSSGSSSSKKSGSSSKKKSSSSSKKKSSGGKEYFDSNDDEYF